MTIKAQDSQNKFEMINKSYFKDLWKATDNVFFHPFLRPHFYQNHLDLIDLDYKSC